MKEDRVTVQEVLNMPDGNMHVELVNGKIVPRAKTTTNHQLIVGEMLQRIYRHIKLQKSGGEVLSFLPVVFDDYNMFLPDILVVFDKGKLENDLGCVGAPDWIIEVAVPESRKMDYFIKLDKYLNAGVQEYWIVDFELQKVIFHNLKEFNTTMFSFEDTVGVGIFDELEIDFKKVSKVLLQEAEESMEDMEKTHKYYGKIELALDSLLSHMENKERKNSANEVKEMLRFCGIKDEELEKLFHMCEYISRNEIDRALEKKATLSDKGWNRYWKGYGRGAGKYFAVGAALHGIEGFLERTKNDVFVDDPDCNWEFLELYLIEFTKEWTRRFDFLVQTSGYPYEVLAEGLWLSVVKREEFEKLKRELRSIV